MLGVVVETIGSHKDHVHMVIVIPPQYSIVRVRGQLKAQSASALRGRYTWLRRVYWKEKSIWSPGYFISSVDVDEELSKTMSSTKETGLRSTLHDVVAVSTTDLPVGIYKLPLGFEQASKEAGCFSFRCFVDTRLLRVSVLLKRGGICEWSDL